MGAYFAYLIPNIIGYVMIDPISEWPPLNPKLPIRIHLAVHSESNIDFELYGKLTIYHTHSAIIIHWNRSHLIHWDDSGKIAHSIKSLM